MKVKKIVSIMLCVLMIFGVMSVGATHAFAAGEEECEHTYELVSSTEPTYNSHGETKYQCSKCGEVKTEYTPATTGYAWDFSTGSAESVNGDPKNTLSWYSTSGNTPVSITNQELVSNKKILSMSQPVTLDSSNNWTIEIVAKSHDGTAIKTVLSTSPKFSGAQFIYINGNGDMCLGQMGDLITNDNTTIHANSSNYTYYKVSQEDYDNSILNSGSFDINEYHTYQMRCIDGQFYTYVDGNKIGKLSMSERNTSSQRSSDDSKIYSEGTGTHFDFSKMIMNSLGVGNSSGVAIYGLTADAKYLGVYPGQRDYCVWDFEKVPASSGSNIVNTSGTALDNELSVVKSGITGVTKDTPSSNLVADGTLNLTVQTSLKMSKSIELESKNDWTIELVAQKLSTETDKMGSFISEGVSISAAKYFYITNNGDLSLVKKGSYTDDNGKPQSNYTYYKVSNADFTNNMPADFDITEEHTYQVRCINERFSYWLDGKKIGDFALSEVSGSRGGNTGYSAEKQGDKGTPFWDDFKTITLNYIGCGSTTNYANQALRDTKVKSLAVYRNSNTLNFNAGLDGVDAIDPVVGYKVKLPTPVAADASANFLGWNDKQDGTGTMYSAGDIYELSGLEKQDLYGIWGGDITVEPSENGTVTADVAQAKYGDTVTLTVNPDEGYGIKNISAGDDVTLTTDDDGATYTFTMPAHPVTVTAEFDYADGMGIHLAGHSISLDGDIAVNFYMELSDEIADSDTAYMQFSVPNTSAEYQNQKVMVSEAVKKGNYYMFNCRVAAKDMNSEITAKIVDGDQSGTEYTYSVKRYADYLIDHQDESETFKKAVPLVEAMLEYGKNAEYYFDKTGVQPEDIELTIPAKDSVVDSLPTDVKFLGATLSLKSQTSLSLYFDSDKPITLSAKDKNGNPVECEYAHDGSEFVIRIRNISAKALDDNITVTVERNGETGTVIYSPTTYCYKVTASETVDSKLKNTVKALYLYWEKAYEFFN